MAAAGRPDPQRLGGIGWLERTNGALTGRERRRLLGAVAWGQALGLVGRVKLATGRVPASIPGEEHLLDPPDSALARAADQACADQPAELAGHARRTWIYGRALAVADDTDLDPELFYVAALLHDTGLVQAVAGEDFTLRSGQAAARCLRAHGHDEPTIDLVRDAISAHVTPGASVATDGPLGYYVQAGAVLDLGGLRACDLSAGLLERAQRAHSRAGVTPAIIEHITAEAAAVPAGRFALLAKLGFTQAIRLAPFDQK
jgi:hypothetical protein